MRVTAIQRFIETFVQNEDGAVTADWVVLTAAVALLSVPVLVSVNSATQTATTEVADKVVEYSQQP